MGGSMQPPQYYGEMASAIKESAQMQADSAQKAMDIANEQFDKSLATINQQYAQARGDLAPYRDIGTSATNEMYDLMGLENPNMNADAGKALGAAFNQMTSNGALSPEVAKILSDKGVSGFENYNTLAQLMNAAGQDTATRAGSIAQQELGPNAQYTGAQAGNPNYASTIDPRFKGQIDAGLASRGYKQGTGNDGDNTKGQSQVPIEPSYNMKAIMDNPDLLAKYNSLGLPALQKFDKEAAMARQTETLRNTPGYQFAFTQGQDALENSAAARGMLGSGNTFKEITDYGQGMADQTYQKRIQNLSNLMNTGQSAAAMSAQQAQSQGQDIAAMDKSLGDTLGSGEMAKGNALAQGNITSKRWDILQDAQNQQSKNAMIGQGFGMIGNVMGAMGGMGGMKKGGKIKKGTKKVMGEC